MSVYSVKMPSASASGAAIACPNSSATVVHTAIAGTASADEVWLWLSNNHATNSSDVTIVVGAVTYALITLPAKSNPVLVIAGQRLNNGLTITVNPSAGTVAALVNVNGVVF